MANTMRLEIVTPDAIVYNEDVLMVTMPCADGEIGVYPLHVSLITQIVPGEIVVQRAGVPDQLLAIGEGLADISAERVSIVTDMAIPADRIDEAKVEEARRRAAARLEEKLSDEEVASVNASLARSLAQLNVKRRQHHR